MIASDELRARRAAVDSRLGQVFWIERGLIVRERDFADWDEALRVAGIPLAAAAAVGDARSPPRP